MLLFSEHTLKMMAIMCKDAVNAVADFERKDVNFELIKLGSRTGGKFILFY